MNAPVDLRGGRVLLLSAPDSFHAAYLRRSLDMFDIPVLAPPGPAMAAFSSLNPTDWLSISACLAVDVGRALFADLAERRQQVPFLFVGAQSGSWYPGPYAWLAPPFAAFQVVEALNGMVAAASAAMQASLGLARTA